MSNNKPPSQQSSLTYLIQATIDNSRGCNAHTVINNTACRVRLSVLTAERLTTDTPTLAKVLQAQINNNTTKQ